MLTPAPVRPWRMCAGSLWVLTFLFLLRVLGQAVQRWLPQPWLPPFAAWQGSSTPYPLLLSIQLVILGAMALASQRAWHGRMIARHSAMKWLLWLGASYMTLALARIAIGLGIDAAPAWFSAWISGVFHIVLAAFLLVSAAYHFLRESPSAKS
jgi:hypothetical protein